MDWLVERDALTFIDFVRVSGAKLNENPSIGFTLDEGLTLTTRASVTFLRWKFNLIHSVDSAFLPTNPAVCFIVKSVWFGNNLGLLLGRKCVIFTSLFSLLFFIEDFKCTLALNIDNYLLPMQSSISLNVAVLRTDVLLLDVSVAKWSFNAPISAAVMMQKMMETLIVGSLRSTTRR